MVGAIARELVDEKLKIEIATMMFVATETTIPIPKLIGYGLTGNTHHLNGLPFLILTHVPGKPLSGVWDELDEAAKVKIYDQMADITIQLRSHPFDRIGSLTVDDRGQWSLSNRPLGRPLASLQRDGIDIRMAQSYSSSLDYFTDYFCHHRRRFMEQPNSASDHLDAREKYAGLSLFESLIPTYVNHEFNEGPFVLRHGDLHLPNILVDEHLQIVAVLDWEWSCVLPIQVACLPPLCMSDRKVDELALGEGRDQFFAAVDVFLDRLREKEVSIPPEMHLSTTLKQLMSNGGYWFGLAIQEIYTFEYLFWDNLFPISWDVSENKAIDSIFTGPSAAFAEEIVAQKLREYAEYSKTLQALIVTHPDSF
jgi:hypothetical protein